jgi:hypothetical protein
LAKVENHFKSDGQFIYLESPYCEFYIPKYYFENNIFAEDYGSKIHCIGVFDVTFFGSNNEILEHRLLNLPTWIDIFVAESETRTVDLPNRGPESCLVIKYIKGEKIMDDSNIEDSANVERFSNFILSGKIPAAVPYLKSILLWLKNQKINSASLGVPSVILDLVLASSYRWKENPAIKFAQVYGKEDQVSEFDYVMKRVREICQYTSTFTGLTYEDMNSMITSSLNRTRNHEQETYSPLEDLIKL